MKAIFLEVREKILIPRNLEKTFDADAIIVGSPVYLSYPTGQVIWKNFWSLKSVNIAINNFR